MKKILVLFIGLLAVSKGAVIEAYQATIVHGRDALPGEIPYQVSLQYPNTTNRCGGTIINENWVVTTANCVLGLEPEDLKVATGIRYMEPMQLVNSAKFIIHENFSPFDKSSRNDIALIKVEKPFKFSELVQPVQLPEPYAQVDTGAHVVVSGWGLTGNGIVEVPSTLQMTKIYVADQEYCRRALQSKGYEVYSSMICTYDPTGRAGQCYGDAGGPLTLHKVLVGIASWSFKDPNCVDLFLSRVYTRVTDYVDWIKERVDEV